MANNHARRVKAYLEEVCTSLEARRRPRRWWEYARAASVPLAIGVSMSFGGCGSTSGQNPPPEVCADNADNDGDKLVDCDDPDCSQAPNCQGLPYGVPQEVDCADSLDNDQDGKKDCADEDCYGVPPNCGGTDYGVPFEADCVNGADDDGDILIDCADPDCFGKLGCEIEFICDDTNDNDADGSPDCADPDCAPVPPCMR